MSSQASIRLASWNRFRTRNLTVAPGLLGKSHLFFFDGHEVNISLPNLDELPDDYDFEERGGFEGKRFSITGRQITSGRPEIYQVHVRDVDVIVSIPGETTVPDEALTKPIKAVELFSEQQQNRLHELAANHGKIARRAFDLWIRTLRWQVDDWQIGMPEMSGVDTGWQTYIKERDTQKDVWAEPVIIPVRGHQTVTSAVWEEAATALASEQAPPIFYDLLYDAMIHLDREDLQRTIVDAALAAETYMRTIVHEHLPPDLDAPLRKYIDRAQISRVSSQFFPAQLDAEQKKLYSTLKKNLKDLFEDRNTIMHSGQKKGLTPEYCQRLVNSVRSLLGLSPYRN